MNQKARDLNEGVQFRQAALAVWTHYRATGLYATAEEADAWLAKLEAGKDADAPECHV